ncbi:hypothetical protein J4465_00395 [Candidatus Pacearchaeota archaeon]|nr:hypothetical protein [Candidatus Pacearchaeota archaeon]
MYLEKKISTLRMLDDSEDPIVLFERNLSIRETHDQNIVSYITKIHGKPTKLYFQRYSRVVEKGKKEKGLAFLGSSFGNRSLLWEEYEITLEPGQNLHIMEYQKIKHLFEKSKKIQKR